MPQSQTQSQRGRSLVVTTIARSRLRLGLAVLGAAGLVASCATSLNSKSSTPGFVVYTPEMSYLVPLSGAVAAEYSGRDGLWLQHERSVTAWYTLMMGLALVELPECETAEAIGACAEGDGWIAADTSGPAAKVHKGSPCQCILTAEQVSVLEESAEQECHEPRADRIVALVGGILFETGTHIDDQCDGISRHYALMENRRLVPGTWAPSEPSNAFGCAPRPSEARGDVQMTPLPALRCPDGLSVEDRDDDCWGCSHLDDQYTEPAAFIVDGRLWTFQDAMSFQGDARRMGSAPLGPDNCPSDADACGQTDPFVGRVHQGGTKVTFRGAWASSDQRAGIVWTEGALFVVQGRAPPRQIPFDAGQRIIGVRSHADLGPLIRAWDRLSEPP